MTFVARRDEQPVEASIAVVTAWRGAAALSMRLDRSRIDVQSHLAELAAIRLDRLFSTHSRRCLDASRRSPRDSVDLEGGGASATRSPRRSEHATRSEGIVKKTAHFGDALVVLSPERSERPQDLRVAVVDAGLPASSAQAWHSPADLRQQGVRLTYDECDGVGGQHLGTPFHPDEPVEGEADQSTIQFTQRLLLGFVRGCF